jgi:transposase
MKKKKKATEINLTEQQEKKLSRLAKGTHSKQHHKQRAKIILLANEGMNNSEIARECGCHRKTVRKWRNRWHEKSPEINYTEKKEPYNLNSTIKSVLEDNYRSGRNQIFEPNQVAEIIALACLNPEDLGYPFTKWSNSLLAEEAIKRGIVESISSRHVGRLLNEIDLKPHKEKGWLYTKEKDQDKLKEQIKGVCNTYKKSTELEDNGTHVICADEMCGIKAIEHCHPSMPARPGLTARYEQEYKRNGTT